MKKFTLILLILMFLFSIAACNSNIIAVDTYNIEEIPPHVENVKLGYKHGFPVASQATPETTFNEFEERIKKSHSDNYVIVECEMIEGGTLYCNTKSNYGSHVLTPVKILKIHEQSKEPPYSINVGDEIQVKEPYFWITPEMDGVIENYEDGTYITTREYYPMMTGKRYLLFAGLKRSFPTGKYLELYSNSYCLSENILHSERQHTYNWSDSLYHIGGWQKYGDSKEFKYEYADIFTDTELTSVKVLQVDNSKLKLFSTLEESEKDFFEYGKGNEVILSCKAITHGEQIKATGIPYLYNYDYCTLTDIIITNYYYMGENVRESILNKSFREKLIQPYYMVTKEMPELACKYSLGTFITHSRYVPINPSIGDTTREYYVYAYMINYNGEDILVVPGARSAVSTERKQQIPEHEQIVLGPQGLNCYLETKAKYITTAPLNFRSLFPSLYE